MAAAENLGTFRDTIGQTIRALLDIRMWVALDIDEDCRLVVRFAGEHNLVPLRGEEVHLGKYL